MTTNVLLCGHEPDKFVDEHGKPFCMTCDSDAAWRATHAADSARAAGIRSEINERIRRDLQSVVEVTGRLYRLESLPAGEQLEAARVDAADHYAADVRMLLEEIGRMFDETSYPVGYVIPAEQATAEAAKPEVAKEATAHDAYVDYIHEQIAAERFVFDPRIDLIGLAMNLRGNADGSAEGTDYAESLRVQWRYLQGRVVNWYQEYEPPASDVALFDFFRAVLDETADAFGHDASPS